MKLRKIKTIISGGQTGADRATISVEVKPDHDLDSTKRGGHPLRGTFWAEGQVTRDGDVWRLAPVDVFRPG